VTHNLKQCPGVIWVQIMSGVAKGRFFSEYLRGRVLGQCSEYATGCTTGV
jgi:hypothetical protein